MLLIEIAWPSALAALALLLAGHNAGGAKPPGQAPSKLQYSFGPTSLVRDGEYIAVVSAPVWNNAQVPPPSRLDTSPCARLISLEDFTRLWNQFSQIDLAPVTHPADGEFESAPPDMNHVEFFRLIIDEKNMIDWSRPDYLLAAAIRRPFDAFNDSLKATWTKRTADLVLPSSFVLEVSIVVEGRPEHSKLEWAKGMKSGVLSSESGKGRDVSHDQFEAFWSELIQDNTLCTTYRASGVRTPSQTEDTTCSMKAVVNGVTVVNFSLGEKFDGRDRFDAVAARLDALYKSLK
jgi:hypothetical protein